MNEKRNKLLQKRKFELEEKKRKLINLERLNRAATPGQWIPMDLSQALQKNEDILLLVELRNNADMLISDSRSRIHTEEFYAVRMELLRELCEEHGLLTEYCNIAANGRKDIHDPPTYQQQIELLKYKAEKEASEWREVIESALGLEPDPENHTKEWAYNIILGIREIGNKK